MAQTTSLYSYIKTGAKPVKLWDRHVHIESKAVEQLTNVASLPFIYSHVAAMPDTHLGKGATIGSVIATKGAIIPAAVGVDIGCGMCAVKTDIKVNNLPDNMKKLRRDIERTIPCGTDKWKDIPENVTSMWHAQFAARHDKVTAVAGERFKKHEKFVQQLGSLGSGNHFVELLYDEDELVWIMLHSGSRGLGNMIGKYFINTAKELAEKMCYIKYLPDVNLAYLPEASKEFSQYIDAMLYAQDYAYANREVMLANITQTLKQYFPQMKLANKAINCHHNYATRENHFKQNVWVTRKGAIDASKGKPGIIPGSMGTKSYIVSGKGSIDSFHSCSHGAGRMMSRTRACKEISLEQHRADTKHVECRTDKGVLDETPKAYKDINAVMKSQTDLVNIVTELTPVLNIKG